MPFDSSGTFNRLRNWKSDAAAGIKIRADYHDDEDDGFAKGLSDCITKDGKTQPLADIPMNGHKIINHGDITGSDASDTVATKGYVDNFKTFNTGIAVDGAGPINGFITFNAPTGLNGIGWNTADMSWIGRDAKTAESNKRLAVNDKIDGTGNDVCTVDIDGRINSTGTLSNNASYDGSAWRTIIAGTATWLTYSGGSFAFMSNDTVTTTGYQTTTPRTFFRASNSAGSTTVVLDKSASAKTSQIIGSMAAKNRWLMQLGNSTAESGTDRVGSDFTLHSYNNAGSSTFAELTIDRSTHIATFGGAVTAPAAGTFAQGVNAGYGLKEHGLATTEGYGTSWINFNYVAPSLGCSVDNTVIGIIAMTSDYRTKKNIAPLASMWETVKGLRPVSFNRRDYVIEGKYFAKDSNVVEWGFVAHEVQEALIPSAAHGNKDQDHVIQSVQLGTVVAALTKALQEALARIEVLEARA